jgi:glutaredoxin
VQDEICGRSMRPSSETVCGYCGHFREAESLVPEWQCPACKTPYVKAQSRREREQASAGASFQKPPTTRTKGSNHTIPRWLWQGGVLLALVFVASRFVSIGKIETSSPAVVAPAGEVWLFTRNGCGYCTKAKDLLAEKGYAYTELNVDTDPRAKEMFQKLQAPGVPVTLVGDREIIGYNPNAIVTAINKTRR